MADSPRTLFSKAFLLAGFLAAYSMGAQTADVRNFQAKGDGKTDDIAALEKAVGSLEKGGVLRFPAGRYRITRPLRFQQNHIRLVGEEGALIIADSCDALVFGRENGARCENIVLENLSLDLAKAPGRTAIIGHKADELSIRDLEISGGAVAIHLDYCYNVTIENAICGYQTSIGLLLEGADKTFVNRGQFGTGGKGIVVRGGKAITLIGVSVERNEDVAIELAAYSGRGREYPDGVNIIGCYLEMNCQSRGGAFLHVGVADTSTPERARGVNLIGNYFNWSIPNRRTSDNSQPDSVPFLLFDQCSVVNLLGNRYANGANYAKVTKLADAKRIQFLNDPAAASLKGGSGVLKVQGEQFLLPFQTRIDIDGAGKGESHVDLSDYDFTRTVATGNLDRSDGPNLEIDAKNPKRLILRIRKAAPGKPVQVSGMIVGRWE